MSIEIGLLLTVTAGIVGLASFYFGRQSAAKKDGQEWGELKSDIRHIKESVDDMKSNTSEDIQGLRDELTREKADRKDSIRRLHERLDNHIIECHNGGK